MASYTFFFVSIIIISLYIYAFSLENLADVKEENLNLQDEVANLNEFGILKKAEVRTNNRIWAQEQEKLWTAQSQLITQNHKIDDFNETVCRLLEHNMNLKQRAVQAEGLYSSLKALVKEKGLTVQEYSSDSSFSSFEQILEN